MNEQLLQLEPKKLWYYFVQLTQIPRPSKKEQKAVEFVKSVGEKLGLETIVDEVGNVIIRKPATPGMENRKTVILQAHLDMVPQKNSDKQFDFEKDPIEAYIDGEWVTANGTTLGADNGIGVAAILAILDSDDIPHPPIEALFTVDEETGMTGAEQLKPGLLKGDILINLDSEEEGEIFVGCAGGSNVNAQFKLETTNVNTEDVAYRLALRGLKGGHSGLDIHLGRGNAAKLLFRFFFNYAQKLGLQIASFAAGDLRNAIPREAFATVVVSKDKKDELLKAVKNFEQIIKSEYKETDPDLSFTAEQTDLPAKVLIPSLQDRVIKAIQGIPNGVIRMSPSIPDLVETSTNVSIVRSDNEKVEVLAMVRSSVDTAREDVEKMYEAVFSLANVDKFWVDGQYPGWKPNMDSEILKVMVETYKQLFGKEPKVKAIHAGLETGIIGGKYPNLDMISIGPTIRSPHSPDERVHIESVKKFWQLLTEVLKNIPEKVE